MSTIQRVVSGDADENSSVPMLISESAQEKQGEEAPPASPDCHNNEDDVPPMVECDDEQPPVPPRIRRESGSSLSSSEASDFRSSSNMRQSDSASAASSSRMSHSGSGNWGWFEDVHGAGDGTSPAKSSSNKEKKKQGGGLVPQIMETDGTIVMMQAIAQPGAMAITAPNYVLEESLSNQKLWKMHAGNRPPQPVEERAFYEKMWAQNFLRSQVDYQVPVEVLTAASPVSLSPFSDGNFRQGEMVNYNISNGGGGAPAEARLMSRMAGGAANHHHLITTKDDKQVVKGEGSETDLTVLVRGDNVFGTTVSKSFHYTTEKGSGVDTVNISVASYRVVESKKHGKFAQFLVIYREGGIRDTIGVWKRFSDFQALSDKVTHSHDGCSTVLANMSPLAVTEEHEVEHLPNAITSWHLLKKRKRWYRCLDAGYLSLKVFLLERFLHDILFESSTPTLLREFVGADAVADAMDVKPSG